MAPRAGWAEQHPDTWWQHVKATAAMLREKAGKRMDSIAAIGLSYQMHGLVLVDESNRVVRNAIIWCDSRAVDIGARAYEAIGPNVCLERLLNSPGNFTASKLRWVREHEPEVFRRAHRMLLPGDYIALVMTGEATTTPSGLSEGVLWDYQESGPAQLVLDHYELNAELLPEIRPTFSIQGHLNQAAAEHMGLSPGIPVGYRAGDQPNNAFSLNVLNPGEIAATAGTSGVVYGVVDRPLADQQSRVNTFVHVNHSADTPRYGMLLCVNGTGILNSWLRHNLGAGDMPYERMNDMAASVPPGAEGLVVLPYGNGAERTLGNRDVGATVAGLRFTSHTQAHLLRAAQEGIVFALSYGLDIMRQSGVPIQRVRAGNANMFLSPLFRETFAATTGAVVELYDTDGAQGAARGAGLGAGIYGQSSDAFTGLNAVSTIEPGKDAISNYHDAYQKWRAALEAMLEQSPSS